MDSSKLIQTDRDVEIERMFTQYADSIMRMAMVYVKDKHLAEDVLQETFTKVYNKYDTFRNESEEKTWIIRIAINTCKNHVRSNWFRRVKTGVELERISSVSVEGDILKDEVHNHLFKEIDKLSYKYKEVILLYYYQEMTTPQIAQVLEIKEGAVRVRLQRAREKLSIKLQEVEADETRI